MDGEKRRQNISLQYPCTNLVKMLFTLAKHRSRSGAGVASSWLVAPYFLLYFAMFTTNTVLWPLQYMEVSCMYTVAQQEQQQQQQRQHNNSTWNETSTRLDGPTANRTQGPPGPRLIGSSKHDIFSPRFSGLCVEHFMNSENKTTARPLLTCSDVTLDLLILSAIAGGIIALFSHFMIWTPLVYKCRALSLVLPPICMMCQTTLFHYASAQVTNGIMDDVIYKYIMLLALLLPALHCNFQGVFLLVHLITHPSANQRAGIYRSDTRLDGSYVVMTSCMFVSGSFMLFFDMDFDYLFFCQIVLGCVCIVYALALMPLKCECLTGEIDDEDEEEESGIEGGSEDDTYIGNYSRQKGKGKFYTLPVHSPYSSSEEELLEDLIRDRSSTPLVRELCKDVPHNFTETSHTKKWIVIIEICVFSIALRADTSMSGPFIVHNNLSVNIIAYFVLLQGIVKIFGSAFIKGLTSFFKLKHGTLICLSAANYIAYYIALAFSSTRTAILAAVLSNFAGGTTFPTLSSFIRSNLRGNVDQVLDKAVICSLISIMCFHVVEYFVFSRTRFVFPGGVFLLCGFVIVISIALVCAIYVTSSVTRKRRKSKYVCDMGSDQ